MTKGRELRRFRRDKDVAVVALAERLGVSRQTVHNWEADKVEVTDDMADRFTSAVRDIADTSGETN